MRQLHQLKIKLLSDINSHYSLNDASSAKSVAQEIDWDIDTIFDALGGCEICFGRGYLITDDIGKFCTCERSDRLRGFLKEYRDEISRTL